MPQVFLRYRDSIEAEIHAALDGRSLPLYRMMSYQLGWIDEQGNPLYNKGRDRLLATLCLLACEATGGNPQTALPAAVAVELVHNFALIHRDLQDGNPRSQRRDSVWWVWGPAQAINAGDGMHALARLALFRLKDMGLSDETVFASIHILDEASLQLCEGQFTDISYRERIGIGVQAYLKMIEGRSGVLLGCALKLGALLASARDGLVDALGAFGEKVGVASHIRDDILALWGRRTTGDTPNIDILNKKKTLPVVYGLEKADIREKRQLGEVYLKRVLEPQDIEKIAAVLDRLEAREYCEKTAERFYKEALKALDDLRLPPWATGELKEMAHYLVYGKQ